MFRLFRDINMKGTTVVVATHDWETVRKMQRRIIMMERGRVSDDGSHPATRQPADRTNQTSGGGPRGL